MSKSETCPCCGMPGIDTTQVAVNFWRCRSCHQAIKMDTLQASVGRAEAGSYNDIASKAFAASSFSPATAEALLESAAKGGGSISRLRMTDEELLAATAIAAKSSGSAEQGGTQINSLLASLEQAGGFEGKSLKSALESIQAMNMNGEELFKYFGRKESVAGFDTLLKNMDLFEEAISKINEAQRTNLAGQKIGLNSLIPEIAAPQALQESENLQALAFSQEATYANFAATIRNKRLTQAQESMGGAGYIGEYMWQTLEKAAAYPFGGDSAFVRSQESRQFLEAVDPATLSRIQNANSYYDSQSSDRRQSQAGTVDALPATRAQIDESNRLLRELVGETKKKPLRQLKRNE
ncbi:hypothetical protein [Rubinisphaera sp.]|uniref:hypothetical protein n=1 Tax=Rubinisphaera sp. TaxID=2024857 RepID=UPI0025EE7559|nr:hypothetical protein [Rubinisphaera sp.]